MKKLTNKARVANRLKRYGLVTNLWAWQNGIWRLSDCIFDLRREGWDIDTEFSNRTGGRNTKYRLTEPT